MNGAIPPCFNGVDISSYFLLTRLRRLKLLEVSGRHENCLNTLLSNYCTQRENVELLKHIKIMKAAPTCFGLQGNPHQGATTST